ncbi:phage terminase small subunit P27 family [Staphylococcus epidermidis]|uniref:phage terminase small subunit P27 family n=1 Tax=Staphylococcus epidermidis TaxID=1282 RepID=UPI0011A44C0E|nr:phage terminase small subunit P27 family [Staphylococcus epidermidis]MCG1327241.1 phage terminase small subunit P27 family [Staphylococcus epidermidis]MCG1552390.1 phage terminase small subunit P27 family [Staphylococcus epidermidis]MCG1656241.1 phage terminase small subunit P27 family [Staphylococcus epidermidis]MCG1673965.1 phage terminase small subunit P27 family [Staphylococcus epidermidis]MCG1700283.1 phage terminase small subunit P27 family [Staphylococcus epidermidis]
MPPRKLLSQQKGNLTVEQQENKENAEKAMSQLTEIDENPPEWLDKDAIKEWHRILPLIQELPIAALDMGLLATYCQTYSNYKNATIQLEKEGMVVETERGTKLSSYYTVQRDSVNAMNSICPKLGLTVESRLKILSPDTKKEKKDEFEDLMNGKD